MASSPHNRTDEDKADPAVVERLIELAAKSERDLLPIVQSGGDVDGWVARFVGTHDLVYCIWEDPSRDVGHDAWVLSGGHELLANGITWNQRIGAIRVASFEAAEMMQAHHGDFRDSPFVECPRLTHIVLLNGGDPINVMLVGDPNPLPLHRSVTEATLEKAAEAAKAALILAERKRRERARRRRDRKRNG
ncbi:hypothetical protein FV226_07555 [Methylobacterium sp. WL12]|uniref:hypothetical protein n=1 Tax=Methylobacterium sp. WL12 TaxID=2603890 RepID=UPI0011C8636F|nr:hypothetical protein [Methylobacterium sp. WL12]TXM74123.1 hypothetical protein FV226_07555 [Methylobacterium sp. WL12]